MGSQHTHKHKTPASARSFKYEYKYDQQSKSSIGTSTYYAVVVQEMRDTVGMIRILQLEHSIAKSLVRYVCMLWSHIAKVRINRVRLPILGSAYLQSMDF